MSRWFRVYDSIVDDPKVQQLSPQTFRGLINLYALTSRSEGAPLSASDIAFKLRMKPAKAEKLLAELKQASLIDETDQGFIPAGWASMQFKSDSSAERMRKHRERHCDGDSDVTRDGHVTGDGRHSDASDKIREEKKREDTDSDSLSAPAAPAPVMLADDPFDRFWATYPKRDGTNPKKPAKEKFIKLCKSGIDPEEIIAGAMRYANAEAARGKVGTPYIARADTWLNQESFRDDAPQSAAASTAKPAGNGMFFVEDGSPELAAWNVWRTGQGRAKFLPMDCHPEGMDGPLKRGRWFPTRLPPEQPQPEQVTEQAA
jgi:hypothetical protein